MVYINGYIRKLFRTRSVCVTGMKGSGKDMLVGNVLARLPESQSYAANIDYHVKAKFLPLELDKLDVGGNTYRDFISGSVKPYLSPLPDGVSIFLSDAGVYLPSQYCADLNRQYPHLPTLFALYRQTNDAHIHINTQNLNRLWDKLREQSDTYLYCRWCKVLFGGLVIQLVTEYDKAQSCIDRVKPCAIKIGLFDSPEVRTSKQLYIDSFQNSHGLVRNHLLIYWNRSKYNTRHFRDLLDTSYPSEDENELPTP